MILIDNDMILEISFIYKNIEKRRKKEKITFQVIKILRKYTNNKIKYRWLKMKCKTNENELKNSLITKRKKKIGPK